MHQEHFDKLIRLKANKLRVDQVYFQYMERLAIDPGIQSQLWFHDSYEHVRRYYIAHESADWCVLD
jgi:hypothetical protein